MSWGGVTVPDQPVRQGVHATRVSRDELLVGVEVPVSGTASEVLIVEDLAVAAVHCSPPGL